MRQMLPELDPRVSSSLLECSIACGAFPQPRSAMNDAAASRTESRSARCISLFYGLQSLEGIYCDTPESNSNSCAFLLWCQLRAPTEDYLTAQAETRYEEPCVCLFSSVFWGVDFHLYNLFHDRVHASVPSIEVLSCISYPSRSSWVCCARTFSMGPSRRQYLTNRYLTRVS